jgi:hypothetical protein
MCSWWWMSISSETCIAVCRKYNKTVVASCWTIIDIYKGLIASFTKDLLHIFKHGHKLSNNSQYFPLRLQGWTCCSLNLPQIKSLYLLQVVQLISVFTTFKGAGNIFLWLTDTYYTHQTFHSLWFEVLQIYWANRRRQSQLSDKILLLYYDNVLHTGDAKWMCLNIYIFWFVTSCQVV